MIYIQPNRIYFPPEITLSGLGVVGFLKTLNPKGMTFEVDEKWVT